MTRPVTLEPPQLKMLSIHPPKPRAATRQSRISSASLVLVPKPLESLYEMVGSEGVPDIINCYLTAAANYLHTIRTAIAQGDAVTLELTANTLRTSSAFLGACVFSNLCEHLEAVGRASTTDGAAEKLPQLETEYERVKTALERHLKFAQCIPRSCHDWSAT